MKSRRIYLIRHGRANLPFGERRCIGSTDIQLGSLGRMQALMLRDELSGITPGGVFSSPLSRAFQTAEIVSPDYSVFPGFEERSAGEWDGMLFEDIEKQFPELYKARGENALAEIPGAEPLADAFGRFSSALNMLLLLTQGDIAIVSHATVIGAMLARCAEEDINEFWKYRLPNGAYAVLEYDGKLSLLSTCRIPGKNLTPDLARALRKISGLPDKVQRHCDAVAKEALFICSELERAGHSFDRECIENAALMHDIARLEPEHEQAGAAYLSALGFEEAASLVKTHGRLEEIAINPASVLFIADKLRRDEERVSVNMRYDLTLCKCKTPEAVGRHEYSRKQALEIKKLFNDACGKEIVP